jgi:outer membrane protein OmpA-like peptidoglycan-associated protein
VASATSNEPAPHVPADVLAELRTAALTWPDAAAMVVTPQGGVTVLPITPRRPNGQVEHTARREAMVEQNLVSVRRAVGTMAATHDGLDLLDLLSTAVRAAQRPSRLVVLSSGVSTSGAVDLRLAGWNVDAARLAEWVREHRALPDLRGWDVTFSNLGLVAGLQDRLPEPLLRRLEEYWLQMCRTAGASRCGTVTDRTAIEPSLSTNSVPVVPVEAVQPFPPAEDVPAKRGRAVARQVAVGDALFAVDSSALVPGALDQLRPLAETARSGGYAVTVVGHTDDAPGPTPDHNLRLSQRRAQAVAEALMQLDVPEAALVAVRGVGSSLNPQRAAGAPYDPVAQAPLRRVVVRLDPVPAGEVTR